MSSDRTYINYLEDILDAVQKVKQFSAGMNFEQFTEDAKTFAVIRAFEVIGEATKQIPDSVKVRYPKMPWREMAGMRDKLIHDYSVVIRKFCGRQSPKTCQV